MTQDAVLPASPMTPVPFRVEEVYEEFSGCFTMKMKPPGEPAAFHYAPGQFNMLYVFGQGEVPISMSGDAENPGQLVHTIRSVGAVTAALERIQPGDTIGVRGPFGSPWPVEAAKHKNVLILAGGLGLAPLRPAIYHFLSHSADYGDIALLYGARSPETILYPQELDDWAKKIEVKLTVDSSDTEWHGHVGVVTDLLRGLNIDYTNTVALVCGPEIMMRFSAYALLDRGMAAQDIYLSMERNMKCALGFCGRCQYGPHFICKDGPVLPFDRLQRIINLREV